MVMIRYSKIAYDNMTDEQLKELYIKIKAKNNYKQANQLVNLIDYLNTSNRLEAVLSC